MSKRESTGVTPDPNATGAPTPPPGKGPGDAGRETHERAAAFERGARRAGGLETTDSRATALLHVRAHQLFTVMAECVRDYAIFLMDVDGIIRYWGEGARLMKWWTCAQIEGAHLRVLYPDGGSDDGTAEGHLQTAAETGEYAGEGTRVRNDGSTFWAGVTLTALRDTDDTLMGFVKVTRDFSARRAIEAALRAGQHAADAQRVAEEANRLKTLFIAGVSHEILTPLNAMMGFLHMLTREGERQQAHIARVLSSGTHLLGVVNDVLDVSRVEAGWVPLESASVRLGDTLALALADVDGHESARGVTIVNAVSGSAGETPYWGDPVRVRHILANLFSNALALAPAGGHVTISGGTVEHTDRAALTGAGPWIYVRVEHPGEGIPADRLDTLFDLVEPVRLSEAARDTDRGLPISRRLARLMGGDLTVQREREGASGFVLWLPIAPVGHVPR